MADRGAWGAYPSADAAAAFRGSARNAPVAYPRVPSSPLHASGVEDARSAVPPGAQRRLLAMLVIALLWSCALLVKLVELQVFRQDALAAKAERQHEATVEVRPRRGGLLDRHRRELALSTPLDSIGIFADSVEDPRRAAAELADAAGVSPAVLQARIERGGFQWVKRLASLAESERVLALGRGDLHFEKEARRFYPHGSVASHVLGTVGIDHYGQGGLEQRYEEDLKGKPGLALWFYDARQKRYGRQVLRPAEPGKDVILTLDLRMQALADMELERAIRLTKSEAGTVVLLDPRTGDVLAMSSWPAFDPNDLSRTPEQVRNFRDFATSRLVEPGSTFKVLTATAAIEEGVVDLDESFDCEMGAIYVGRRRIRDHHPYGLLTLPQVLVKSSNVGIIKVGYRLGEEQMHSYLRRFGFGRPTKIGLPGEAHGLVRPINRWSYSSLASLSMGQEVGVTAIQMARLFAAVANGGLSVQPRIVGAFRDQDGQVSEPERDSPTRVISSETAAAMRSILERVVKEGTGRRAAIKGYRVAGKTGTAQMINPVSRSYRDGVYMASFCGFAPVENPAVVGVAMLYNPSGQHYYGGLVAAPLFARVMRPALRLLEVPATILPERKPRPVRPDPNLEFADFVNGRVEEPGDSLFLEAAGEEADGSGSGPEGDSPPQRPAGPPPIGPGRRAPRGEEAIASAPLPEVSERKRRASAVPGRPSFGSPGTGGG